MPSARPVISSRLQVLALDSVPVGFVKSVEGGSIRATVLSKGEPSDHFVKKFIGPPMYQPVSVQVPLSMDNQALYQWIEAQWSGKYFRKTVSIVELDDRLVPRLSREFLNAWISEVTIPSMEAIAKDSGFVTVQFAPELTRMMMSPGMTPGEVGKPNKKPWVRSNFRLEVDGLDCTAVSKIDSFTVKFPIAESPGELRTEGVETGPIDFPNLRVTFSEGGGKSWMDWFEDFVIQGNSGEGNLKNGSLVFLSTDLKDEVGRVNFHNMGIIGLTHNQLVAKETIRTMTAELYCEWMEFVIRQ